ncbi:HNH endonuclease [Sphingobium yanoikuyae]|uniref:HNH endonuclease n=1 Tax=Sphingobium yanoikuyae TaxID=13690 RepID=UPI0028A83D5E|nr:HNH endonuclease signature motif containing protein [Sphingobium yanoikuyae]
MWKVVLPDTTGADAELTNALTYANGTAVYDLSVGQRGAVHALYVAYDHLRGEPDATLLPIALVDCADAIHDAYGQVQKGQRLADLRSTLLAAVAECPLCGAAPATTLDHHLPRATYRSLAIYARNLIPSCQPCNRHKGTLVPVAGEGMIHAYFQTLPGVTFFCAGSAYAAGSLNVTFSIDRTAVGDPALADRLEFQLDRLKLTERHVDAINILLFTQKTALMLFKGMPGERELVRNYLLAAATSFDQDFGLNHWRAAVMRGLAVNDAFLDDPWTYFAKPPQAMIAPG